MKLPHNIDKSRTRKGAYIGYHKEGAQFIRRGGEGWIMQELAYTPAKAVHATARTLMELGTKLESLSK